MGIVLTFLLLTPGSSGGLVAAQTAAGPEPLFWARNQEFNTQVLHSEKGKRFRFLYTDSEGVMEYCFEPGKNFWGPVMVKINRIPVAGMLVDSGPVFQVPPRQVRLTRSWVDGERVRAEWRVESDGWTSRIRSSLRLWRKTLEVHFSIEGGTPTGLSVGHFTMLAGPKIVPTQELKSSPCPLSILTSRGVRPFYASVLPAEQPSNGYRPFSVDKVQGEEAWLGGGYRRPLHNPIEQSSVTGSFYVTLSTSAEEVIPRSCESKPEP